MAKDDKSTTNGSPLARFDGYVATDEPLELRQVLFIAGHRWMVKEQMDRKQWQAERTAQNRARLKEVLGYVRTETGNIGHASPSDRGDGADPPPASGHWFYGVSWLPEERDE